MNKWSNTGLLRALEDSRLQGYATPDLSEMIFIITSRFINGPSYCNYTFKDDMMVHCFETCHKLHHTFDPAKSSNPLAYFVQITSNSAHQYITSMKKKYTSPSP